jgi:hypothetical protein
MTRCTSTPPEAFAPNPDLAHPGGVPQDLGAPPRAAGEDADCECDDCDCPICLPGCC